MHLTQLAREHGDKPAVIMAESGATLSYAELERQSNQIAHLFRARGLRPGDHIAVLMENRPEFFPVVWAAQRSGLLYTPVNWHLSAAEAAYIVADCGARLLVASSDLEELAAAAAASAPALRGPADRRPARRPGWSRWRTRPRRCPTRRYPDELEGYYMLYSSGTTGQPKGILPALTGQPFGTGLNIDHTMKNVLRVLARHGLPLHRAALPRGADRLVARDDPQRRHRGGDGALRRGPGAAADRALPGHPRPVRGDDVRPDAEAPGGGTGRVRHLQPAAGRAQPPRRSRSRSRSR